MAPETWRTAPGFVGRYEVSDQGRVRATFRSKGKMTPRVLRPQAKKAGHLWLGLIDDAGQRRPSYVHRLVAAAFIGPCPDGQEVRHLDGDPSNNRVANLAYGTRSENIADAIRHGTHFPTGNACCKRGHPFDEANTVRHAPKFERRCRACRALLRKKKVA